VAVTLEEAAQLTAHTEPKKRGPKARHSGMFVKGDVRLTTQRANRYPALRQAQKMAEQHVQASIGLFAEILNDDKAPRKERMEAGRELLNRAVGTPVSMSVHKDLTDKSDGTTLSEQARDPRSLADAEIIALIQQALSPPRLNHVDDDDIIDVHVED
jgi:hypothetical protein